MKIKRYLNFYNVMCLIISLAFLTGCTVASAKETLSDVEEVIEEEEEEVIVLSATGSEAFGINLANLSEDDVKKTIEENKKEIENREISVVGREDTMLFTLSDFMYKIDVDKTTENIMNEVSPSEVFTMDNILFEEKVAAIKTTYYIAPKNATMRRENGQFVVLAGSSGSMYNEELFNEKIQEIFFNDSSEIVLEFQELAPKYTEESFANSKDLLGTYSSNYNVNATSRNINLAQASANINGSVLYPGDVFSTNQHFGETTIENGYSLASVIVNNELVDGLGGGVCQISSTLYMAVLHSEIEIVERLNHSLKVSYMDYGFDATLANPYIDFKFKNNTDSPIYVEAGIYNGKATVSIYGKETRSPNRSIKFYNKFLNSVPTTTVRKEDPSIPKGKEVVEIQPLDGMKYALYKDIYENGVYVDTVQINTSYYTPREGKILVGTKEVQEIPAPKEPIVVPSEEVPIVEEPKKEVAPVPSESGGGITKPKEEPKQEIPSENPPPSQEPIVIEPEVPIVQDEIIVVPDYSETNEG